MSITIPLIKQLWVSILYFRKFEENSVENLTNESGTRFLYAKSSLWYRPLENSLAPIQETFSFSKNATNTENKNYFAERIRDFEKIFPDEQKIYAYDILKKKRLEQYKKQYKNNLKLFEETKKNLGGKQKKKTVFSDVYSLR